MPQRDAHLPQQDGSESYAALFEDARTHNVWLDREVPDELFRRLYDRSRWAPTSANSNPGRFVFIKSAPAKERLRPHLWPQNVEKTMAAPVCVIVAADSLFYDFLPKLFPSRDMRSAFAAAPALAEDTATRNAILQGGYLILAARSLGLDCGPMSGFDRAGVDREFFPDGVWKSNFLINLGYGDTSELWPRNPRLWIRGSLPGALTPAAVLAWAWAKATLIDIFQIYKNNWLTPQMMGLSALPWVAIIPQIAAISKVMC